MSTTPTPAPNPAAAPAPTKPAPGTPEHDAAMVALADARMGTGTPAPDARPAWLPEKFKSAEDLAKAYGDLEKKLGAPAPAAPAAAAPAVAKEEVVKAGLDWDALNTEFAEKGALSAETYAKLAEKGFAKDRVDTYVAGQKALAEKYDATAFATAGGQEQYSAMVQWAVQGLSPAEQKVFNEAVVSGDEGRMAFAVKGLRASYEAANGTAPKLVQGTVTVPAAQGYNSLKEQSVAQRDPRYKTDPGYRKQVEDRIRATTAY